MSPSLLLYLFGGALVPTIGFAGVSAVIGYWTVLVSRYSVVRGRVPLPQFAWLFAPLFLLVVALGMSSWQRPFDIKDPLALLMFFVIVPALLGAMILGSEERLRTARQTFFLAFLVMSAAIIIWAVLAGVNWQRSYFFFPSLHKNSIGATYEVLLFVTVLGQDRRGRRLLLAGLGLLCLILVGSKTALAVSACVLAMVLFGGWGVAMVLVAAVGAVSYSIGRFEADSSLRNLLLRFLLWAQAWDEITSSRARLLFGVGPGTFTALENVPGLRDVSSTHNLFLNFWHAYGLAGTALFTGFFAWLFRRFGVTTSPFLTAFWVFNAHALFDVGWVKGAGFVASAAFGLGIIDVAHRRGMHGAVNQT